MTVKAFAWMVLAAAVGVLVAGFVDRVIQTVLN